MSLVSDICKLAMITVFIILTISTQETLACIGGAGGGCCQQSGCSNPCAGFGKK